MRTGFFGRLRFGLLACSIAVPFLFCGGHANAQGTSVRRLVNIVSKAEPSEADTLAAEEKQTDIQHLREIYKALQAYRAKNGRLPGWLSDLVPDFLPDTNVLMSPIELRTGQSQLWGYGDPKVHSSYIYEFNNSQAGGNRDQDVPLTMREWKTQQMEEFGPVIPILRCHLREEILNVSYSGEVYETALFWETDTNTLALMEKLGPGPGASKGRKLRVRVEDSTDATRVPGVVILGTNRQSEFGPLPPRKATTGADGSCEMNLGGKSPKSIKLVAEKPGFAREVTEWSEGAEIPETVTLKLRKACEIGGAVVGSAAKPIRGALVVINGLKKDAVGQVLTAEIDRAQTGPDGKWRSTMIPADFESLSFAVSHPEYMPGEFDQVAQGEGVTTATLKTGKAKFELQPALEISGSVKDTAGKAVANAKVQLLVTDEERPLTRDGSTDESGQFRLFSTFAGSGSVLVQANGLAAAWRPLNVEPGLQPLQFTLNEGRSIGGLVKDDEGKPLAGVQATIVSVVDWTNAGPLNLRTMSDEQGGFAFRSVPSNQLVVRFEKQGFSSTFDRSPPDDATNWSITLAKPFQLRGKVLDAETGDPIKQFTVWHGGRFLGEQITWWNQEYSVTINADGSFSVQLDRNRDMPGGGGEIFAIKADGYIPEKSELVTNRTSRNFEFKMRKGKGLIGVLQDKDAHPVEDATVVLGGPGSPAYMDKEGQFRKLGREQQTVKTDAQGRFEFQPALDPSGIAACNENGFVEMPYEQIARTGRAVLQPWAVVKGCVKLPPGTRERSVGLHVFYKRYSTLADRGCSIYLTATIAEDGAYAFYKVPPGERRLYILYKTGVPGPLPLSHGTYLKAEPGQTYTVNFGDTGRSVIGRVNATGDCVSEVDWQRDFHTLKPKFDPGPQDEPLRVTGSNEERQAAIVEYNKKQREFWSSQEGVKRQQEDREYILQFDEHGAFSVHGIPPGKYTLRIACSGESDASDPQAQFRMRYGIMGAPGIGSIIREIEVPEAAAGEEAKPVDLGTLEMKTSKSSSQGPARVIISK